MARLINPIDNSSRPATPGERRFERCLKTLLEDDYLCWHDVPIGPRRLHPDFVVLHPRRGLLVLEVKETEAFAVAEESRGMVGGEAARNRERDLLVTRTLRKAGWRVFAVWECDLVRKDWLRIGRRVTKALEPGRVARRRVLMKQG